VWPLDGGGGLLFPPVSGIADSGFSVVASCMWVWMWKFWIASISKSNLVYESLLLGFISLSSTA
jgi:hypothetical protein